jgi:tripartite-type tricarboxylate transporter receptor subunit TctC
MRCPAECYVSSTRPYPGLPELDYSFHDKTLTVTTCGRICFNRQKINLSTVFAGQKVGIKQVSEEIWLVTFWTMISDTSTTRPAGWSPSYPSRAIKIVTPNTPGSPVDALGRLIAQQMQVRLGQSVIIENRPGGSQSIGAKAVATADADGYTLLLFSNGHYFGLATNPGYDPVKSFTPVATVAEWNHVLVVRPDFPAKTVSELIAFAKSNSGKVTFGFGLSTPPQILGETLKNVTGADTTSVPYRGGAPAVTDMLGGRIDMNFGTTATLLPLIQQGQGEGNCLYGCETQP